MEGSPIEVLNPAMSEIVNAFWQKFVEDQFHFNFKIGVLTFADHAKWLTSKLENIEDFIWEDVKAGGIASLGSALRELNQKMSRQELIQNEEEVKCLTLIFLSDGLFDDDWEETLEMINKENQWIAKSIKAAVALGGQADISALTKIVDNDSGAVFSGDEVYYMVEKICGLYGVYDDVIPESYYQEIINVNEKVERKSGTNVPEIDDINLWD